MPSPDALPRARAAILGVLAMTVLPACVPFMASGYEVTGDGRRGLNQFVLVRDELRINAHSDVLLRIYASTLDRGPLLVNVESKVPEGVRVRWLADELTYRSQEWPAARSGRLSDTTDYRGGVWQTGDTFVGQRGNGFRDPAPLYYTVLGNTREGNVLGDTDNPIREFSVDLPPMEIDGRRFEPGTIRVRAYRRLALGMLAQ